jgi:ketosteroid isomerase-like protein
MTPENNIDENKQLVTTFFERLARGDVSGACDLLHDDLGFWTPVRRSVFGKVDAEPRLSRVASLMEGGIVPFEVKELTAEANRVAALVEVHTHLADGTRYDQFYSWFFRVRQGKLIEIREYNDTALVVRVGLSPRSQ